MFGPHPRDYSYKLPAKVRTSALSAALNEKYLNGGVLVLDKIEINEPRTREVKEILNKLKIEEKTLIVLVAQDKNLQIASKNIPKLNLALAKDVNALDILKAKKIVFLADALPLISRRINNK